MGTDTMNFYETITECIRLAKKISHKVPAVELITNRLNYNHSDQICKTILTTTF